jgi:hypothetical protein
MDKTGNGRQGQIWVYIPPIAERLRWMGHPCCCADLMALSSMLNRDVERDVRIIGVIEELRAGCGSLLTVVVLFLAGGDNQLRAG